MNPSAELNAALEAAARAAQIVRSLYQRNVEVHIKADKSPVTEADVRCEIAIREILEARFPSYGFFGEETGSRDRDAESIWLVDPIDGTKAFVREYPMFSTQIALMRGGELVLDPWPATVRDVKFATQPNAGKPAEPNSELRPQVAEFFAYVREVDAGEIRELEVRHGLPFSMEIELQGGRRG